MSTVKFVGKTKQLDAYLEKAESALRGAVNVSTSGNARTHHYYSRIDRAYGIIGDIRVDMVHDAAKYGTPRTSNGKIIKEY